MLSHTTVLMFGSAVVALAGITVSVWQRSRHDKNALKSFVIGVVFTLLAIGFALKK